MLHFIFIAFFITAFVDGRDEKVKNVKLKLGDKCDGHNDTRCSDGPNYKASCEYIFNDNNKQISINGYRCVIQNECVKENDGCRSKRDPVCCPGTKCTQYFGEDICRLSEKTDEKEQDRSCRPIGHRCSADPNNKIDCCENLNCVVANTENDTNLVQGAYCILY